MTKENEVIDIFRRVFGQGLYDDVGFIRYGDKYCLFNTDTFVESSDAPPGMGYRHIGWKSVVSSISDIFVKGGKPVYLCISLTLRSVDVNLLEDLALGLKEAAREYKLEILKWDTNSSRDLSITVTSIGFSDKPPILRSGAKTGDIIVTTDYFGLEKLGLKILLGKIKNVDRNIGEKAVDRFLRPRIDSDLYEEIFTNLHVNASIDSSDGLARSLWEISRASNKKIELINLPIHPILTSTGMDEEELIDYVLYGGEEYYGIFCIPKEEKGLSEKLGLIYVGKVREEGVGVFDHKGELIRDLGWLHSF